MALVADAPVLLGPTADQYGSLIAWVGEHPTSRLLDLGAGSGIDSPYGARLRTVADTITGIDPEEAVLSNPHLDDARQVTAEEFAAASVILAGGVAANLMLREALVARLDIPLFLPEIRHCMDNGAMIAMAGAQLLERGQLAPDDLDIDPGLELTDLEVARPGN